MTPTKFVVPYTRELTDEETLLDKILSEIDTIPDILRDVTDPKALIGLVHFYTPGVLGYDSIKAGQITMLARQIRTQFLRFGSGPAIG